MGRVRPEEIAGKTLLLLVALALGGAGPAPASQQEPVFRVDVRLVRMLATVKDATGQPVGGMRREDFRIYDNGVLQEVALFERHTEQPLSIALLVDTSGSTAKELPYETDSVLRFLRALVREGHPGDALSLFTFNHDVTLQSSFTRNVGRIETTMRRLKGEAGTSLYDAICFAASPLADRDGRRVMVVVTDGGDTTSTRTFHDALRAAHAADATIYSILVVPIPNDPGRNVGGENALATLSQSTGGRVFAPSVGPVLDQAFADILRALRTQYLLGFYPRNIPPTREEYHRLRVEVERPDLQVVTRSGYYGEFIKPASGTSARQAPSQVR